MNIPPISIGSHTIGLGHSCFVIAEAGVNHNGNLKLAKDLVRAAKKTGAQCVKFQTFQADRIVTDSAPKAEYQLHTTDPQESQKAMLKKLELPLEAYEEVMTLCNDLGILFLSTPYNKEDIDFLDQLGVQAFKFASIHIFEPSLLAYAAQKGKPLIVSTGMATLEDVELGLNAIRATGNQDVVVLQCTTNYPSRVQDCNLHAMQTMQRELNVLVGYSDHTQTDAACMAAIALDACVIEKHFTLDQKMAGPDQSTSYTPEGFTQLMQNIYEVEAALGSSIKEPCQAEVINSRGMRRSITARKDILAGTVLTEEMLTFMRPGTGIPPAKISELIGKVTKENISARTPVPISLLD